MSWKQYLKLTADRLWSGLTFVPLAMAILASPSTHRRVAAHYWGKTKITHGSMEAADFEFYAERITELAALRVGDLVLDYGCGNGEIGKLLLDKGLRVEFAEFAPHFVHSLRDEAFTAYLLSDVPRQRYNTVFANNSFFYNHPRLLVECIRSALSLLCPGGRLLLTDNPTLQRVRRISGNPLRFCIYKVTGVYQPQLGGFFIDEGTIRRHFPDVEILDSWSGYRRHFVIRRSL